ncbi:hypothetical protein [Azospirillum largimobile]
MRVSAACPIIVTNCTQRKRRAAGAAIRLADCAQGPGDPLAAWLRTLSAQCHRIPARDLYCGRSFQDAIAATTAAGGTLWIASAGLGLVPAERLVPSYSATVAGNGPDSVPLAPSTWFTALQQQSPFSGTPDLEMRPLVLAALSSPYLRMMEAWLLTLAERNPGQLRLFSRVSPITLAPALRPFLMPYDARLDDRRLERSGTVSDFAQRALRHFVETVLQDLPAASLEEHRAGVEARLASAQPPKRPANRQMSDEELCHLIRTHWQKAEGRAGRMLALMRGTLGVACEQGRFARLFRSVVAEDRGALA